MAFDADKEETVEENDKIEDQEENNQIEEIVSIRWKNQINYQNIVDLLIDLEENQTNFN